MIASVIIDINHSAVDKVFDYLFDEDQNVTVGSRVIIPFSRTVVEGFVMEIKESTDVPIEKLKKIIERIDETEPIFPETMRLVSFVKEKYHAKSCEVLRLMIPSEMRGGKVSEKERKIVRLIVDYEDAMRQIKPNAKNQIGVIEDLSGGDLSLTELAGRYSYQTISTLISKGILEEYSEKVMRTPYEFMEIKKNRPTLTADQEKAIERIKKTDKLVTLIKGVTGSGKTEIYMRLFESALEEGKTSIMLVPEIALTPQMVAKLRSYFKENVAIIHSGLSKGERFDEWWRIREGEAKIVVGARSAIFSPIKNLGYIVIDEEHETSYKSESSPRYETFEVAKFRASDSGAKIVLGSATPSVASYYRAKNGEYELIEIKERVNKYVMPSFDVVDLKNEIRRGNKSVISEYLRIQLADCLKKSEQAILFLNRRGFASYYQCEDCGYVCSCNSCDVSLTYHKFDRALKCHYCGTKYVIPKLCPDCGGSHFKQGGMGTETVVGEIQRLFPSARILRMDNDTTGGKNSHHDILQAFREKKADFLVGTQMVAKGHDFPNVTLVGIINADMSLYFSDYMAGERTFQLITQVAGRAGRAEKPGRVVLQTYSPEHHILKFATKYDYEGFFEYEVAMRKNTSFPPFADVVRGMIISPFEDKAKLSARAIYNKLLELKKKYADTFAYFNAMKAPIGKIENKYRFQILMRLVGDKREEVLSKIYEIVDGGSGREVLAFVEVNPSNMF